LLGALIAVQSRPDRGRIGRTAGTRECRFEPEEVAMTARTDDYDEILRVMQLYIDGFNDNDVSKFKAAFHEDAWIFYIEADGVLHKNLISESFERWAAPPSWGVVGRFISVTQVGDAASVQVSWDRASDKSGGYIDFHNLLRINGVWKITNKTATHSSR
jgi:ketosteroid isomerase-like protein